MARVLVLHSKPEEARAHAATLRRSGHRVGVRAVESDATLRALASRPPEVFVIDLDRVPSQGRAVGIFLRRQKATRDVPIVFAGGDAAKVEQTRKLIPDAAYAPWSRVRGAVTRALRARPAKPVVPDTMAGYSGTPLPRKLGIKPGSSLTLLGAPPGFDATLGALPEGVTVRRRGGRPGERVLLFVTSQRDLHRRFPGAVRAMAEGGGIWIIWPKQASGVDTDLNGNRVRRFGLDAGFVDYKICAVDATWSGLLFARREP
jgi:CheY-like chemotaxis protein